MVKLLTDAQSNYGFFDNTFFSNKTHRKRQNERYKRIIYQNIDHVRNKKIIDIASHNGLWSFAALENGAEYTFGIEGRQELIDSGMSAFSKFDRHKYEFVCDDIFNALSKLDIYSQPQFDTVFCLGIFYHIMDHYRLMQMITQLKPEAIIMDTGLINSEELVIKLYLEDTDRILNAIPERDNQKRRLVGFPSVSALKAMAESCGYKARMIEWCRNEVEHFEAVKDYFTPKTQVRKRFTFLLTPSDS